MGGNCSGDAKGEGDRSESSKQQKSSSTRVSIPWKGVKGVSSSATSFSFTDIDSDQVEFVLGDDGALAMLLNGSVFQEQLSWLSWDSDRRELIDPSNLATPVPSQVPVDHLKALAAKAHNPACTWRGLHGGLPDPRTPHPHPLFDCPMVSQIAFKPRVCSRRGEQDGVVKVADGVELAYHLLHHNAQATPQWLVLHFHSNAELCTDIDRFSTQFEAMRCAVISFSFRGFAWSSGSPTLSSMYTDTDRLLAALPQLLPSTLAALVAGGLPVIAYGRSMGACCAVHAAVNYPQQVHGLLLDSGLHQIKQLPVIQQLASRIPLTWRLVADADEPVSGMSYMPAVTQPTMFIHGTKDQLVPLEQAVSAHSSCGAPWKKLVQVPAAGHNNLHQHCKEQYWEWFRELLDEVAKKQTEVARVARELQHAACTLQGAIAANHARNEARHRALENEKGQPSTKKAAKKLSKKKNKPSDAETAAEPQTQPLEEWSYQSQIPVNEEWSSSDSDSAAEAEDNAESMNPGPMHLDSALHALNISPDGRTPMPMRPSDTSQLIGSSEAQQNLLAEVAKRRMKKALIDNQL